MTALEAVAIFAAGIGAGSINTVVGSGTLLTFPVLLGFGYAPLVANVSNTVGLVPGSLSGAYGYRNELAGQRRRAIVLGTASMLGSIAGAVLLLGLPASAFKSIVPVFIVFAHIDWRVALLLACGSVLGGQIGARVGRRLPPAALRGLIVLVGISAIVKLALL